MNIEVLQGLASKSVDEHKSKPCKKGDKRAKCRRKKHRYYSPFAVLFPSRMGTPKTFEPGSANGGNGSGGSSGGNGNGSGGDGGGMAGNGGGGGSMAAAKNESLAVRPSRVRVLHEMKKSLGLLEFAPHNWGGTPSGAQINPAWGGYSIPQLGMIKMRKGGPTIGGPGFKHNVDGEGDRKGGRYDLRKSPGIGFRTEYAWRIWDKALDIMAKEPALSKKQILMQAMSRAGVMRGQIDASEVRLIEMGIEWYLTEPGALASKRDGGGFGGGKPDSGATLAGPGAP